MHDLLRNAWKLHDDYPVGRYVIMPEHVHLFIGENNRSYVSLPNWVAKWKGYVTRRWHRVSDRPIWQRSFWDRQLLGAAAYESKWIYVHWIPSDTVWLFTRMIGRFRERWLNCGGDSRGRRVYPSDAGWSVFLASTSGRTAVPNATPLRLWAWTNPTFTFHRSSFIGPRASRLFARNTWKRFQASTPGRARTRHATPLRSG